jgi:hypothetical protein
MPYTVRMGAREEVVKKIARKQQEISDLELRIREGRAFIQGMEEVLKILPKENSLQKAEQILRPGTAIYSAREAIKQAARPLHIADLLKALKLEVNKKNRLSLSGSLSGYARRGEVFTRPAPNTFGLVEFGESFGRQDLAEPPDDFGGDVEDEPDHDPEPEFEVQIEPLLSKKEVPF